MLMTDFSGGLSTRLSPNLIQINESTICENVDLSSGSLKPLNGLKATSRTIPVNTPVFTEYKGIYLSSNSGTSYVEFNDALYIANAIDTVKKTTDGINIYPIGLSNPTVKLTTTTSFNVSFTLSNITSGSDITFTAGTYTYLIQYKTTAGSIRYEVKTFTYSGTKGITLTISSMSNLESVTLYRKVDTKYRLVGETTSSTTINDIVFNIGTRETAAPYEQALGVRQYVYTYYSSITGFESAPSPASDDLEVDINNVVISGFIAPTDKTVDTIKLYRVGGSLTSLYLVENLAITASTYIDIKTDLDVLDGTLLTTTGYIQPPIGLKFLTEFNSALFGSIDSTLWFSNPGTVDQWTENNWITFPEHITGLGVTQNGLLVFSRNKTWILVGDSLATYSKYLLNGNQGCVSYSTISYVENNLLWYSLDGICLSKGGAIELLSWLKLGKLVINPITAETYENQYFLFHEEGTVVVDFRAGVKFYTLDLVVRGAYYSSSYDKLYLLKPKDIGMYEYNSGDTLNYKYKTGYITHGSITNYKTYKNIYIYCKGTSELKLYVNSVLSNTFQLVNGVNNIRYKQEMSKGYYTELEFEGSGEILEVYFIPEGRQNGI